MKYFTLITVFVFFLVQPVAANNDPDADHDGVPDKDEINIYHTDVNNPDTDGDGYGDWVEINNGYSPLVPGRARLKDNDFDGDRLSDYDEIRYGTDLTNADTDGDGFNDGDEVRNGFDPLRADGSRLEKHVEINLAKQELSYFNGAVKLGTFKVSSGKASMPTPKGEFKIKNKYPKAWSKKYGLWMPYWLGLADGSFGIHELPVWPNGYREGANHIGIAVSHGCIRLGIGPAKILYDWADVGTRVEIE